MSTYFSQPNLTSPNVSHSLQHPSKQTFTLPTFTDKEDFRKWCLDPLTKHYFFSLSEAVNPHHRVSGSNPLHKLHGFVGDYDGDVDITDPSDRAKVIASIKSKAPIGWEPNWICRTYSGKVRLIWEFEEPVLLADEDLASKFIDMLAKETKCRTLIHKGGWDSCSKNPAMFWEQGRDWEVVQPTKLDPMRLEALFFEVFKKSAPPSRGRVNIPMEVVKTEIDERFPGRWVGEFDIGRRGPLFWIDDGVNRVGCVIQEGGVWCYSTRAGKNFISWSEIFGEKFVKNYREKQLAEAVADTYYDGKKYHVKDATGNWGEYPVEEMTRRLRLSGFSPSARKKGDPASEIDEVLVYIQDNRRISGAAPFIYNQNEIVKESGETYINTVSHIKPLDPANTWDTSKWPNLEDWMMNIMPDRSSFHALMSWMKHYYEGAIHGKPAQGHTLILAGNPDMGKSLFSVYLLGQMFGGARDAGDYLMGAEKFNNQLGYSPIWVVDDNASAGSEFQGRQFGEKIKKLTATPKLTLRAMYSEPIQLTFRGRMVMTTNLDADALSVVPRLTDSIMDKLLILKLKENYDPWFRGKSSYEIEDIIDKELPYFLCWLHDQYEIPVDTIGSHSRFGFKAQHNLDIVNTAKSLHGTSTTYSLLVLWWQKLAKRTKPFTGTEVELLCELQSFDELDGFFRKLSIQGFRKDITNLSAQEGSGIAKRVENNGVSYYTIDFSNSC